MKMQTPGSKISRNFNRTQQSIKSSIGPGENVKEASPRIWPCCETMMIMTSATRVFILNKRTYTKINIY